MVGTADGPAARRRSVCCWHNPLSPGTSKRQVPLSLSLGPLTTLSAGLGQAPRLGKGISYRPSKKPEKPIELWVRPPTDLCMRVCSRVADAMLYIKCAMEAAA